MIARRVALGIIDIIKDVLNAYGYLSKWMLLRKTSRYNVWEMSFSLFLGVWTLIPMFFPFMAFMLIAQRLITNKYKRWAYVVTSALLAPLVTIIR